MEKVNMTFTSLHTQRVKSEWIIGPNVRQIFLKEDKRKYLWPWDRQIS